MNRLFTVIKSVINRDETDGVILFWSKEILIASSIFALFWFFSNLVTFFIKKWGGKIVSWTSTDLDDKILNRITPHISRVIFLIGIYLSLSTLPLFPKLQTVVTGIFFIIIVILITILIYSAFDETLKWYVASRSESANALMSSQMVPITEKIISLLLISTALIIVLKHFNYDILSLVTALGVGSLAVGMAAKDTLAHLISGFTIMLDRPFRIGDRIVLSGGEIGDVTDIGLRSTKIRTLDNQLLIIPNSDLCNTMVTNQAFPNRRVKGRINIGVGYGSDVENVKSLLIEIAQECEDVLKDPSPEAFFVSFGDFALNMTLFFWVDEYSKVLYVTDKLNIAIIKKFGKESIDIPYPTRKIINQRDISTNNI